MQLVPLSPAEYTVKSPYDNGEMLDCNQDPHPTEGSVTSQSVGPPRKHTAARLTSK